MPRTTNPVFRKWIIRGISLGGLVGLFLLLGGFLTWTSPTIIQNLLVDRIRNSFLDTKVHLDGVQVNLWGGITANGLRLGRGNGFDSVDFLNIPKAQIVHDKEAILEGRLAIRKIELFQPSLRIIRNPNGSLNVDGMIRQTPGDTGELPSWSVHQGQVVFEDRLKSAEGTRLPNLEIRDLKLTGMQDTTNKVRFEMSGHGDWLGPLALVGQRIGRKSPMVMDLRLDSIAIKAGLLPVVSQMDPSMASWIRQLSGTLQVKARGEIPPEANSTIPLPRSIQISLRDGAWGLPVGDVRIEKLEGEMEAGIKGIDKLELRGKWNGSTILAQMGKWDIPWDPKLPKWTSEQFPNEIHVEIKGVRITQEMLQSFGPALTKMQRSFQPEGLADIFMVVRKGKALPISNEIGSALGAVPEIDLDIRPLGMNFVPEVFPYQIRDAKGKILCKIRQGMAEMVDVEVQGKTAGGGDIQVQARGKGRNGWESLNVKVDVQNAPIDMELRQALSLKHREAFDQFQPSGRIDLKILADKVPGLEKLQTDIEVRVKESKLVYRAFPYPLENVSGILKFKDANWFCEGFKGENLGAMVYLDGRSWQFNEISPGSPATLRILIRAENLPADNRLRTALDVPQLQKNGNLALIWDEVGPEGLLRIDADVVDRPDAGVGLEIKLKVHDGQFRPKQMPYVFERVSGTCQIQAGRAIIENLKAHHGSSKWQMAKATALFSDKGGLNLKLFQVQADPLVLDPAAIRVLPIPLRRGLTGVTMEGPIGVKLDLAMDFPADSKRMVVSEWDGQAFLRGTKIHAGLKFENLRGAIHSRGKHNGQSWNGVSGRMLFEELSVFGQKLEQVSGRFEIPVDEPSSLRFADLQGKLYGGQIGGEARIDFLATTRYDLLLKATQIRLDEFGRVNLGDANSIQGLAAATLHLGGIGTDFQGLRGYGSIDVPQGKLYKLPVFLDLIKTFGFRIPDGTAFEQAHALFSVDGALLRFQQLDLFGNAISLRGKGIVPMDGRNMSLEFRTDWARAAQFLPTGFDSVPNAISEQMFLVKVQGNLKNPKIEREILPGLTQPFRKVFRQGLFGTAGSQRPGDQ